MKILSLFALLLTAPLAWTTQGLVLKGEGTAYFAGFIKVYEARLYGPPDVSTAALHESAEPLCLELTYDTDLSREELVEAGETILARQLGTARFDSIRDRLESLHRLYRDVNDGDSYRLCRRDGMLELAYNGKVVARLRDRGLGRAYLGIWLDEGGISDSLREDLLSIN
jgi:hypothetical protein